jgi:hypothetical protein
MMIRIGNLDDVGEGRTSSLIDSKEKVTGTPPPVPRILDHRCRGLGHGTDTRLIWR